MNIDNNVIKQYKFDIGLVRFKIIKKDVIYIQDCIDRFYGRLKASNLQDLHFVRWANQTLNEIQEQVQAIQEQLHQLLTQNIQYISRLVTEKSIRHLQQHAQKAQKLLREAAFTAVTQPKSLTSLRPQLETHACVLVISINELHQHVQKLIYEETLYLTFFEEV